MVPMLPEILFEGQNKKYWEFDGWKPKAKPGASPELKKAIAEFLSDIEEAEKDTFVDDTIDDIEEM